MSGTSMDGIDVALIRSDGEAHVEAGPSATFPYHDALGSVLRALSSNAMEAEKTQAEIERQVTDAHVNAVQRFLEKFAVPRETIALVGLHGQTILHRPQAGLTRQLCDGARAAKALGIDIVCDFRSADVAAGGQGAPLAPIYHAAITSKLERPLIVLNWGGVGNITWLGRQGEILAFDTGPANAMLDDFLIRRRSVAFDANGDLARTGRANLDAVRTMMRDPYFGLPPPKSLDRNHFRAIGGMLERLDDADGAATLSAFTIAATAAALQHVPEAPSRWLVSGGGRRNAFLVRQLAEQIRARVDLVDSIDFDGDALEAQCFAYLALRSRRGAPLSFPSTTGVPHPMTGGVFWPA